MPPRIVSESITVEAPPDVVFGILADPRQHARIDGSGTVLASVSGPDRLGKGAEFGMSMRLGVPYRITNRVVEFDEGRQIAWRHLGGHRWRYELEAVDGGTRVTESGQPLGATRRTPGACLVGGTGASSATRQPLSTGSTSHRSAIPAPDPPAGDRLERRRDPRDEEAGFVVEGRQRQHAWVRGGYEDIVRVGILRQEPTS